MVELKEYTDIHFAFTGEETRTLVKNLTEISSNPYVDYRSFDEAIQSIVAGGVIPERFVDFTNEAKLWPRHEVPCITITGCPIDDDLPFLDFSNPVIDKRARKATYVSEAFLLIYAKLMAQEPIGYANVNDGDVFQDIHPWDKLAHTQSQKALADIGFHKDLANHFVRPDWVNILGLRQSDTNYVFTSFTRNIDVLDGLTKAQRDVLSTDAFYTPFDDLTVAGGNVVLGEADTHPVIGGVSEYDIRIFENRTIGLTPEAQQAIYAVIKLLHHNKRRFRIKPGHFLGEANNESIHCKEIVHFEDQADLRNRWLQKTVNVADLAAHAAHFIPGQERTVNG